VNYKTLFLGLFLFLLGQIGAWYQTNGQFISVWMKNNPLFVSLIGIPVSLFYIKATEYIALTFDGEIWPTRLLGFSMGILSFTYLTYLHLNEGVNLKTGVILILATVIVLIQVFWK